MELIITTITMEAQLNLVKENEIERIKQWLQSLDLEDYFSEWDVSMQEHSATFAMMFPNFLRFSYVVLLYSTVENKLHELCVAARQVRRLTRPVPKPKNSIINQYKEYISEVIGINNLDWDSIYELSIVRKCIVHNSGKVSRSHKEQEIRDLVNKVPGLRVSNDSWGYSDELQPLYLEDNMLMLESTFCKYATKNVRLFLEKFCDAIPLQPTIIE